MAKTDFKSVDEYIASQPEAVQGILGRVRSTIRNAVPGAVEVISYKIPAYKLHSGPVLYFAGWKQHYSLYPATERVVAAFKDKPRDGVAPIRRPPPHLVLGERFENPEYDRRAEFETIPHELRLRIHSVLLGAAAVSHRRRTTG